MFLGKNGKAQRGDHKDRCRHRRHLAEEGSRAPGAEDGLARTTEGRPDLGAFAGLQQNDAHHDKGDEDMHDGQDDVHADAPRGQPR